MRFLSEWWQACQQPRWIDPFVYGPLDARFRWWTPEQGILSVLASNWVLRGRLPLTFPVIEGRLHQGTATDYEYLKLLSLPLTSPEDRHEAAVRDLPAARDVHT
jgi:hypothetical protein